MGDIYYLLLWTIFFVLSIMHFLGAIKYNKHLTSVLLLFIAFFVGYRNNIGFDWISYVEFYNTGVAPDKESGSYEPIFMLTRWLFYSLGFRYEVFFFFLSFIPLFFINICAEQLGVKNIYLVFLVYVSLFFCIFQLNIVRSGFMASCLWLAFTESKNENNKKAILWCIIAAGFHIVALLFIPLIFVINKKYSLRLVVGILSVGYIVMSFHIGDIFLDYFPFLKSIGRVAAYLVNDGEGSRGITIGAAFNLAFLLYMYFTRKNQYIHDSSFRLIINVLVWGLFVTSFFNSIGMIATRVGQVLNMSLIFVWPYFIASIKNKGIAIGAFLLLTVYLVMFYNKAFLPNELLGYSSIFPFEFRFTGVFR